MARERAAVLTSRTRNDVFFLLEQREETVRKVLVVGMFFVLGGVMTCAFVGGRRPGVRGCGERPADANVVCGFRGACAGVAVIVIPGGSYEWLATNHEGRQIAN
jgi:hypothetical protein